MNANKGNDDSPQSLPLSDLKEEIRVEESKETSTNEHSNKGAKVSSIANAEKKETNSSWQQSAPKIAHGKTDSSSQSLKGIAGIQKFLFEVMIELKKITWPSRQQVIRETLSVIVLVTIITAAVLAFDYGIAKAVFEPMDKLARHLGGGIGVHH